MKVHGNAALGPAGRVALVQAIESGMTLRAAARPQRGAGHSPPVVAPLAFGRRGATRFGGSGCATAPRDLNATLGGSVPPRRSRSCVLAGRRTSAQADWRGSA